jgi:hypothetical protein
MSLMMLKLCNQHNWDTEQHFRMRCFLVSALTSCQPVARSDLFPVPVVSSFWGFCMNGILKFVAFYDFSVRMILRLSLVLGSGVFKRWLDHWEVNAFLIGVSSSHESSLSYSKFPHNKHCVSFYMFHLFFHLSIMLCCSTRLVDKPTNVRLPVSNTMS